MSISTEARETQVEEAEAERQKYLLTKDARRKLINMKNNI